MPCRKSGKKSNKSTATVMPRKIDFSMKFAFILDTSPLMQIKKSVVTDFSNKVPPSDLQAASQYDAEESKVASQSQTGMSFFEQSIFAIEEFISIRKKTGQFKQDKYFLALTASNVESNTVIQDFT